MPFSKRMIAAIVVLAVAAAVGIYFWRYSGNGNVARELTLYGNVDIREADVPFQVSERVEHMIAEEGDRVKKGQLLATLKTNRLKEAESQAEARVRAQEETVAALVAGTRPEEIRKARAEVNAAKATANNARRTAGRLQKLVKQNLASQEQADDAKAAAEAAEARLKAAQEALALAVAGPRSEDIKAAKASLKALRAELALARINLADAHLTAPVAGVIRDRILEPGEMASPDRPAYTIALDNPIWVRVYVPEPELGKIAPGMKATVSTDSFPGRRYEGWIGYISPTAEFTPKSVQTEEVRTRLVYQVRVMVCNPQGELRLGMPAIVQVPLDQPRQGQGVSDSSRCGRD